MKARTKIFIIAICVLVLVAVFVSPTSALYYQELLLEAGFTSRSFNMDTVNDDSLKLSLNTNATFNYGFFTETTEGAKYLIFKIDYDNVSYVGDVTSLDNTSIVFSKKVGNTWVPLSQNEDGDYYDSDLYSVGDKGLYSLSITYFGSEKLKATVPVVITSVGGGGLTIYVPMKDGGVELNQIDNILIDGSPIVYYTKNKGDVNEMNNVTIIYGERTDDSSKLIAYAYDKNGKLIEGFNFSFDSDNSLNVTFTDTSINNGDHVKVEIYFPKSVPVNTVEIKDAGIYDFSGLVANNLVVSTVKKENYNQAGTIDISDITIDSLTVSEYYVAYNGGPTTTISNIKPLNGESISLIDVCMRSGGSVVVDTGSKIDTLTFRPVNSNSGEINLEVKDEVDNFNIDGVLAQNLSADVKKAANITIDTKNGAGVINLDAGSLDNLTIVKSNESAKVYMDAVKIENLTANMGTSSVLSIDAEQYVNNFAIDCAYVDITCQSTSGGTIRSREAKFSLATWDNAVELLGNHPTLDMTTDFAEGLSITGTDEEIKAALASYNTDKTISYTTFYYGNTITIEMDD